MSISSRVKFSNEAVILERDAVFQRNDVPLPRFADFRIARRCVEIHHKQIPDRVSTIIEKSSIRKDTPKTSGRGFLVLSLYSE
ncbi:hypothetical protein C8039_07790 [Halogeometricum sp. wsp3]|nr:hypothetical protein C8039_07790 [Halogeometricum sp. wsp3]